MRTAPSRPSRTRPGVVEAGLGARGDGPVAEVGPGVDVGHQAQEQALAGCSPGTCRVIGGRRRSGAGEERPGCRPVRTAPGRAPAPGALLLDPADDVGVEAEPRGEDEPARRRPAGTPGDVGADGHLGAGGAEGDPAGAPGPQESRRISAVASTGSRERPRARLKTLVDPPAPRPGPGRGPGPAGQQTVDGLVDRAVAAEVTTTSMPSAGLLTQLAGVAPVVVSATSSLRSLDSARTSTSRTLAVVVVPPRLVTRSARTTSTIASAPGRPPTPPHGPARPRTASAQRRGRAAR